MSIHMSERRKAQLMMRGFFISFSTLWVGSYIVSQVNSDTWYSLPLSVTLVFIFISGLGVSMYGLTGGR